MRRETQHTSVNYAQQHPSSMKIQNATAPQPNPSTSPLILSLLSFSLNLSLFGRLKLPPRPCGRARSGDATFVWTY